ncbi:MAG: hypothetical protein HPY87_09820 [Fervidobacterium sp.]|uniref:hypothetical protein n=1 Tax=Fervidobacterium sp. TaxID=1871331 RepID=UPI0025C66781|nr:hypothetical protein [Fervidobacterium sp.]NPU90156.1 hypothetical protein [Fervidobacterium sp.]
MVAFKYEKEFHYFVGIDPSWTGRKPTAVVVVKLNELSKKLELEKIYLYKRCKRNS